jgi:protein phosphatase
VKDRPVRDYAVTAVGRTHVGLQKPNNEDSFHIGRSLLLVADGVGGSAAGEVASRTVVDIFADVESASPDGDLYAVLTAAVDRSTHSLLEQVEADPELEGMGTTATVMMWSGHRIVFAQIGDSRAYYLQQAAPGGRLHPEQPVELQQITKDDSFVQHLVDQGLLAPAEAARHPRRNVILKALNGSTVSPSFSTYAPRIGDRYLLCSDGLSDYVDADDILDALIATPAEPAAAALIDLSLAAGAPDNVTVIIADIVPAGT